VARTPAPAPPEARALSSAENAELCAGCVKCCTYIAIEVDTPRSPSEYDQWIWALHHRGVSLYVERPEKWFLCIETICEQLDESSGRCRIHGRHPVLCREYDPRDCERRLPLTGIQAWFHDAAELETWLRARRPKHWERLMAYRKDQPAGPPTADAHVDRRAALAQALITIGDPPRR